MDSSVKAAFIERLKLRITSEAGSIDPANVYMGRVGRRAGISPLSLHNALQGTQALSDDAVKRVAKAMRMKVEA